MRLTLPSFLQHIDNRKLESVSSPFRHIYNIAVTLCSYVAGVILGQ